MIRRLLREIYLLPPGEQRALLLLSLLVILTLGFRLFLGMLPQRKPAGLEEFQQEAREMLIRLKEADSLNLIVSHPRSPGGPNAPSLGGIKAASPVGLKVDSGVGTRRAYIPDVLDLNKADSAALLCLPGIGPVFAGRIVKYRSLLGGYADKVQLSEVYGMSQETLGRIDPFLVIDLDDLKKLPLNACSFRELLRHPYLEYEHVKSLVQYIDREGSIDSVEDIRKNYLLPDTILVKIAPYLDYRH